MFFFLFIGLCSHNLTAQNCSLNLSVSNNIESVNNEGRIYFMEIRNNSNKDEEVILAFSNSNIGKNPDQSSSEKNVILDAKFLDGDGKEIKENLKLSPNENKKFQVKVTVPAGTSIEHWNNLMISATSKNCADYSNSLTLYTFVPNPLEW